MKRILAVILVLAMAVSLAGCCSHSWVEATCTSPRTCNLCGDTEGEPAGHIPRQWVTSAVDTKALTMTRDLICDVCGQIIETQTAPTGSAPVNSVLPLSPDEWYACLLTCIQANGMGQSIYGYPAESPDDTLLHGLVSTSHMMAVFSFLDPDGNTVTTEERELRNNIHNIRMDAQFTNDNAKEFYVLLMILAVNNNSSLSPEDANNLAGQIMGGNTVTDNGYTYAMEIISAQDHTVCVSITAE